VQVDEYFSHPLFYADDRQLETDRGTRHATPHRAAEAEVE
jgi:hypothetical protein